MVRITLRLPDELHRRIQAQSRGSGVSVNQLIVAALSEGMDRDGAADEKEGSLLEQVEHTRMALGDLAVTLDADHLPEHIRPGDNLPDVDVLRGSLSALDPPLSATISADREDRW